LCILHLAQRTNLLLQLRVSRSLVFLKAVLRALFFFFHLAQRTNLLLQLRTPGLRGLESLLQLLHLAQLALYAA
jgi:hypothetical protein